MTSSEPGIFISYRRNVDGEAAARLAHELRDFFGDTQVFIDIASIEPGVEFPKRLREAVTATRVVLAVISPKWLDELRDRGFDDESNTWRDRLDADFATDWVRHELALAMELSKHVIPIFVQEADCPSVDALPADLQGLAQRNGVVVPLGEPTRQPVMEALQKVLLNHVDRRIISEDAKARLDEARKHVDAEEYELASEKAEQAIGFAERDGDDSTRVKATLFTANALDQLCWQIQDSRRDERRLRKTTDRIKELADEADRIGALPQDVACVRMRIAVIEQRDEDVLRLASIVVESEDSLSQDPLYLKVTAINAALESSMRLDRPDEARSLVQQSRKLETQATGESRLVLAATRLPIAVNLGADAATEVEEFSALCSELASTDSVSRGRMVSLLGRLASIFNSRDQLPETLMLLKLSHKLAEPMDNPQQLANICMQTGEIASVLGLRVESQSWLGGDLSVEKCRDSKVEQVNEQWASLHCMSLATRGRALKILAERASESDPKLGQELLLEAKTAFEAALAFAEDRKGEIRGDEGLFLAQTSMWLGITCRALGMLDDAASAYRAVRERPEVIATPWAVSKLGIPSWNDEIVSLAEAGRLVESSECGQRLRQSGLASAEDIQHLDDFEKHLEEDIVPVIDWLETDEARRIKKSGQESVSNAVAEQVLPLIAWWDEWRSSEGPWPVVELLDFWGRGAFARVVTAVRGNPLAVIAVDALTIDDIRHAARVFCPIFDTVLIKWKGALDSSVVLHCPVLDELGGEPNHFGGHGYGRGRDVGVKPGWGLAIGGGNVLPRDVATFLATEAISLFSSGRLAVLPAPLVGCTQTSVGWTDDLLLDNLLRGVVSVCGSQRAEAAAHLRRREIDLQSLAIPFIDRVSMDTLATVIENTKEYIDPFRKLTASAIGNGELKREEWSGLMAMQSDIRSALRELDERFKNIATKSGGAASSSAVSITVASRDARMPGHDPVTDCLRSIAPIPREVAPWVPFWRLEQSGGVLDWACPFDNPNLPMRQGLVPDVLFSQKLRGWLVPGTMGCGIFASWGA